MQLTNVCVEAGTLIVLLVFSFNQTMLLLNKKASLTRSFNVLSLPVKTGFLARDNRSCSRH